ncbi:fibrinogen C domain-containing protein 1-B-like [Dysidea avara]|uniref:fibrinogen C domain-containing protein 1-B-like n=1 Tax=Dysidea avara TaxID=196820 RepID=UPI0033196400
MTTIITLVVLVSLGIVLVDGECQTNGGPIDNCCCLGYNNNNYNVKSSGVYTIGNFCEVKCSNARVYCDTTSGGGGWTVIQRRKDGSVDFFGRDWVEYEDGFGSINDEFWLGLRPMHCLTSQGNWELRIDYRLPNGTKSYLHYKQFAVGPAEDNYRLNVSGFVTGRKTDPFDSGHPLNRMQFSARDEDNDHKDEATNRDRRTCAKCCGGWWHNNCGNLRLNENYNSAFFIRLNGEWYNLPFVEMKIRPLLCDTD